MCFLNSSHGRMCAQHMLSPSEQKKKKKWIENVFESHFFCVCFPFISMFEQVRVVGPYKYQPVRLTVETVDRVEPERWLFLRIESSIASDMKLSLAAAAAQCENSPKNTKRHSSRIRLARNIWRMCALPYENFIMFSASETRKTNKSAHT